MTIVSPPGATLGVDDLIWVGIVEPQAGQRHCGFIYRIGSGERLLHLAFHYDLRDEIYNGTYWSAPLGLDIYNQAALAAIVSTIAAGEARVPYGFDFSGEVFDKANGDILNVPPGVGLTCATFILAVLRTHGFQPTNSDTWIVRPTDQRWQNRLIHYMESAGASVEHISAVRSQPASARFRPEEVVGCVAIDSGEWPVEFDHALALAAEVLTDMGIAA